MNRRDEAAYFGIDPDVLKARDEVERMKARKKRDRSRDNKNFKPSEKSPFLRMSDILEMVPISRGTVYNMIKEGTFPKSRPLSGRLVIWDRSEVEAWIKERLGS